MSEYTNSFDEGGSLIVSFTPDASRRRAISIAPWRR